jgi:uncharacterized membrane protein YfcA
VLAVVRGAGGGAAAAAAAEDNAAAAADAAAADADADDDDDQLLTLAPPAAPLAAAAPAAEPAAAAAAASPALAQLLRAESRFPWATLGGCGCLLAALALLSLLRGGRGRSALTGVRCGSPAYVALVLATLLLLLLAAAAAAALTLRTYALRRRLGYPFVPGDLHFTRGSVLRYALLMLGAGLLAGFLGIGGGMVIGPLLLALGLRAEVATATTAHMTLYTSSSAMVQYLILGRVPPVFGAVLFGTAMVASAVGYAGVARAVRAVGRPSLLVFVLLLVVAASGLLLVVTGALQLAATAHATGGSRALGFHPLCDPTEA